jgi:diguanylate cyclase (GGDEF)-like protein
MPAEPLRVLLVEDDEDDFTLTTSLLSEIENQEVSVEWAASYGDGLSALVKGGYDVCLVDYNLGERTGLELLREATAVNSSVPMIMLTGHGGYEVDAEAMKAGAADYLVKSEVSTPTLERSLRYAIRHSRLVDGLRKLARRDELTGLYNRRAMDEMLREETDRHSRYGRPAALVMLDVDCFKSINDSYGHLIGDEVLRWLAQLVRDTIRTADIPTRYGGEELAIILPEMNSRQAVGMAERLRRRVAACPFESRGRDGQALRIHVTISLGVAGLPDDALDADALVAAADEGLYAAKRAGRNRAVRFGDLTEQSETI